jgi:hypothetical protein
MHKVYSTLTGDSGFIQPPVNLSVTVAVDDNSWMVNGKTVYVEGGGLYKVLKIGRTSVQLTNLPSSGNAPVGATVPVSGTQVISPLDPTSSVPAYTTLTAGFSFKQPAKNVPVTVQVADTSWMRNGKTVLHVDGWIRRECT